MRVRTYFLVLLLLCRGWNLLSQSDLMLYNFNAIGQSLHTNPGMQQQSKFWLALPGLAGASFNYHNNGFALVDLLEEGSNVNENLEQVSRNLDGQSHLTLSGSLDLLGIGFKAGNGFVSMGSTVDIAYRMDLPGALMKVLFVDDNNNTLTNFSIDNFEFETVARTNLYLGYQHTFLDERLTVGARYKYIIGQAHSHFERARLSIENQSNFSAIINTDVLFQSSGRSLVEGDNLNDPGSLALTDNRGMAIDLGATYKLTERWELSASIIDLGSITWQQDVAQFKSDGTYEFDGVDVDLSNENTGSGFDDFADTLVEAFNFEETQGGNYTKSLMSQVFAGANFFVTPNHVFGALYHARIWNGTWYHDIGINYQGRLARDFQIIGGYSIINGVAHNIGAGLQAKLGPVQLFVLTENLVGAIAYQGLQTTNVRLGINIAFLGSND